MVRTVAATMACALLGPRARRFLIKWTRHRGHPAPRKSSLTACLSPGCAALSTTLPPLAGLQPPREVAAAAQLGHRQVDRAHPRVPGPRAVAVALRRPFVSPLVAPGPDLSADLRLHEFLHQPAHALVEEVGPWVLPLAQYVHQCHPVCSHRVFLSDETIHFVESTRWCYCQPAPPPGRGRLASLSTPLPGTISLNWGLLGIAVAFLSVRRPVLLI